MIVMGNKMKTASEILELHFGSDFWMLKKYGFKSHIINAMKEYASDQIEKERERIKKQLQDAGECYCFDFEIDETPIILE